jgi:glycosyltransferase involved in cell wall biosynthesis
MSLYNTLHRASRCVVEPWHKRESLRRALLRDLGAGRPRTQGRCLVSFLSDSARYLTQRHGREVWNRDDLGEVIDRETNAGRFAGHHLNWESAELIRLLIERGHVVDCIYDRDGRVIDDVSGYDVIIDEWTNLPRWQSANPRARTWYYGTTAHWLYWNHAELQRLRWLFARKGADVAPSRQLPPLLGYRTADVVTFTGSDYIRGTYGEYGSRLTHMFCASTAASAQGVQRDWERARRRFLYFGSAGWVHRGLDLVLEAFSRTGLDLTVCCTDTEFLDVYRAELSAHPNITVAGFITPVSDHFQQLVRESAAMVYPSAAEGRSMAVVQCMQYGLIPVVTRSVGLGLHDWLPVVEGATDRELVDSLVMRTTAIAEGASSALQEMSDACWLYALTHHSRASYRECMGHALDQLLA